MNNRKLFVIFIIFFLIGTNEVRAYYREYVVGDFVYYNPIDDTSCNQDNYYTYYNQNTNCYRWNIITISDTKIKIMLDHNVAVDNYANYTNALKKNTSTWKRYNGMIDIITESEVYNIMKLSEKPTISEKTQGSGRPSWLGTNTMVYYNSQKSGELNKGYWVNGVYDDDYSYIVNESIRNSLKKNTEIYGIRPVISVDRNDVAYENDVIKLTPTLKYQYKYVEKEYDNTTLDTDSDACKKKHDNSNFKYYYKQMQGFTITNDKIVIGTSYSCNSKNSQLIYYSSTDAKKYSELHYEYVENIGHMNDMTYNSKNDEIYIVGPMEYQEVWVYDAKTMIKKKIIKPSVRIVAISYDEEHDLFYGVSGTRAYLLTPELKIMYSFDIPRNETGQGIAYYKGYLYVTTFEAGMETSYQIYYDANNPYTGIIYVYDVLLNSNKEPTSNFSKLSRKLFFPTGYGELETATFFDNKLYLGVAAQHFDSTNVYKIFNSNYTIIENELVEESNNNNNNNNNNISNGTLIEDNITSNPQTGFKYINMVYLLPLLIYAIYFYKQNVNNS